MYHFSSIYNYVVMRFSHEIDESIVLIVVVDLLSTCTPRISIPLCARAMRDTEMLNHM